jgi:4-amino-4-deoxy-L-arabinose transferase-like glycosyltransferase
VTVRAYSTLGTHRRIGQAEGIRRDAFVELEADNRCIHNRCMRRFISPGVLIALLFLLLGLAFIRKAGMHYDASYELVGFYPHAEGAFSVTFLGHSVPVMVLPYLGAFKAWLYWPLLRYLELNPVVLRLPLLLAAAVSVWLSWLLLIRISGPRAAIAGSILLATDASFLIASTYDFGPVVFLHCFLLAGVVLLLRFERSRSSSELALAFFLFGLALWHKALFVWMLDGVVIAACLVFPRRIMAVASPRRLGIAAASLALGALPLLCFNVVSKGATLHTEAVMSGPAPWSQKVRILKRTVDGSAMFGWLTEEMRSDTAIAPRNLAGRLSVQLDRFAGSPRSNWMLYLLVGSCCLVPWLCFTPARGPALFTLVYLAVTWAQMLVLPNTGGALHHVILLWPFPHFLIAIAAAQISFTFGRYGLSVFSLFLIAVAAENLMVVNHYEADLIKNGTTVLWTDAVYPMSDYLNSVASHRIITTDWGYATTLCLFSEGVVPQYDISDRLLNPSDSEVAWIKTLVSDPDNLFVDHTDGGEQFPGVRSRLASIAAQAGFKTEVVKVFVDRNQRPRFQVTRYIRISSPIRESASH